jgi:hypothetical protein
MTAVVSCAALVVGWVGQILVPDDSGAAIWTAVLQVLAIGVVSIVVVGGAAAIVDPSSARSLMRMRARSVGDGA